MLWAFRTRVSVTTTSSPFPSGCSAPWTHDNGDATRTCGLPNHRRADRSRLARPLVRKRDVATDSAGLFVGSASGAKGSRRRYLKIAGRWRDHERWAVLAEEWRGR